MALKYKGLFCSSSWDSHRQLSPGQHQHPEPRLHFKHTLPEQCAADNSGTGKKTERKYNGVGVLQSLCFENRAQARGGKTKEEETKFGSSQAK